jgi:cytidine deaminase
MAQRLSRETRELLVTAARRAANNAHAPYSGIRVGAAALTRNDRVFVGCNVENASLGLTNCAERVAVQSAVAAGEKRIVAVAVSSPDIPEITPCGACRQVLAEFSSPQGLLVIVDGKNGPRTVALSKLLPAAFTFSGRP